MNQAARDLLVSKIQLPRTLPVSSSPSPARHLLFCPAPGSEDGIQPGKIPPTVASVGGSSGSGGFAASLNGVSMILGGEEAPRWGKAGAAGAEGQSKPPRLAYLREKSAATR